MNVRDCVSLPSAPVADLATNQPVGILRPTPDVVEALCQMWARALAHSAPATLRFSEVTTPQEWRQVTSFRLEAYSVARPYMLSALDDDGADQFDKHSSVFAAWIEGRPVATLRLTPYPFETCAYVGEGQLASFLGAHWQTEYLEFSRLLVNPELKNQGIAKAVATYAGLRVLVSSPYQKYFGYTTPIVRRILSSFAFSEDFISFQIPSRGEHSYQVLRGDFAADFKALAARFAQPPSTPIAPAIPSGELQS